MYQKKQKKKLIAATLMLAAVIVVALIMPAQYAVDPTGIGGLLGLLPPDSNTNAPGHQGKLESRLAQMEKRLERISTAMGLESAASIWRNEEVLTLYPGQGVEAKLVMDEGAKIWFEWSANGSRLNCDSYGDSAEEKINYARRRGAAEDKGTITAPFSGTHGWFWRNRTEKRVTLTLKIRGAYSMIKWKI